MSDSSDIDDPIGKNRKKKEEALKGLEKLDDLSDYLSDDSMDSEKKRAKEEAEIK